MLSSYSWTVCREYCLHQGKDVDPLASKAGLRCFHFYYSRDVTLVVRNIVRVAQVITQLRPLLTNGHINLCQKCSHTHEYKQHSESPDAEACKTL
jgi:hypothetical protein